MRRWWWYVGVVVVVAAADMRWHQQDDDSITLTLVDHAEPIMRGNMEGIVHGVGRHIRSS